MQAELIERETQIAIGRFYFQLEFQLWLFNSINVPCLSETLNRSKRQSLRREAREIGRCFGNSCSLKTSTLVQDLDCLSKITLPVIYSSRYLHSSFMRPTRNTRFEEILQGETINALDSQRTCDKFLFHYRSLEILSYGCILLYRIIMFFKEVLTKSDY